MSTYRLLGSTIISHSLRLSTNNFMNDVYGMHPVFETSKCMPGIWRISRLSHSNSPFILFHDNIDITKIDLQRIKQISRFESGSRLLINDPLDSLQNKELNNYSMESQLKPDMKRNIVHISRGNWNVFSFKKPNTWVRSNELDKWFVLHLDNESSQYQVHDIINFSDNPFRKLKLC